MARIARVVIPNLPHHVTQRGNRRQTTFFNDNDYRKYIELLAEAKSEVGVEIWAYCLMPNHVHLIAVPEQKDSLANLFRQTHQTYSRFINARHDWRGHLWQERFHSSVMDPQHTLAAVRYVERNPVRAGICANPTDWPWSSARPHVHGEDDQLVSVEPMLRVVTNWKEYLDIPNPEQPDTAIRLHARTGKPLGCDTFIAKIEHLTGRDFKRKKPGPKGRARNDQPT